MRYRALMALLLSSLMLMAVPSDSLRIGLVTCYPGSDIYELEGHSAIHVQGWYQGQPIDVAVNYGVFNFNAPNFVYRFVKGETDYLCAASDWHNFLYPYVEAGRTVIEHPLRMDSVQKSRLVILLSENLLPQNRVYRYNYVKDNCATRPLAMIERAFSDTISLPQPDGPSVNDHSFREVMERYHKHYPWYQFGIDLALGSGIDYPISAKEKSFAPIVLSQQLDGATIGAEKLTDAPVTINEGHDVTMPPTPWILSPMAVCWAIFVLTAIITWHDWRRQRVSRWYDAVLFMAFGMCGLVLTFLIFVSTHEATSPNWLYLWLNPLCLIVPIFIWLKKCKNMVISYQFINFALILTMIVAWPWTGQRGNLAFIPLILSDLTRSANYIILTKRLTKRHK